MLEVVRVSDRIILIRITVGKKLFVYVCMHPKQTLVRLRTTDFTKCYKAGQPNSQLQKCSLSVVHVTEADTSDPSPLGSRKCMEGKPYERGTLRAREYSSLHLLTGLLSERHGSRRNRYTWSHTSFELLQPRKILYRRGLRKQVSNRQYSLSFFSSQARFPPDCLFSEPPPPPQSRSPISLPRSAMVPSRSRGRTAVGPHVTCLNEQNR